MQMTSVSLQPVLTLQVINKYICLQCDRCRCDDPPSTGNAVERSAYS
jgi:hypothetical protein